MSVIGVEIEPSTLVLTKGRDFRWIFRNLGADDAPEAFPAGSLYFEFATSPVTTWPFTISGTEASIKVESESVALIPNRTKWQLVFKPAGEAAGGDPIARGTVKVQS